MTETWLLPNRRALALGMILPAFFLVCGLALVARSPASLTYWLGVVLSCAGGGLVLVLARQMYLPRIAHRDGTVLFYLRSGSPIAVPVESVDCFLLGREPCTIPGAKETLTVVARLSTRDEEWDRVCVKSALASWSNHLVTIRGAWCQPLDVDVVKRLNRLHGAAKRKARGDVSQAQPTE